MRSDMAPVPLTLEAEIRIDDGMEGELSVGKTIIAGGDQYALYILKSEVSTGRVAQGERAVSFVKISAILDVAHEVAFVRRSAIIKENTTLSAIYRAAGAKLSAIDADFPVSRFYCPVGDTPTFPIARALQEAGGIVRWRAGKMQFIRLPDLFKQKAVVDIQSGDTEAATSGFVERHSVPWFFSLSPSGEVVHGSREKARSVRYVPFKNEQQLRNMSRCLVHRKKAKLDYSERLCAGDLVNVVGGDKLAIVTAVHVFSSGTEGETPDQYSRLWLASMEE